MAKRSDWGCVTKVDRNNYRLRYWGVDSNGVYRRMSRTVRGTRKQAGDVLASLRVTHSEDAPCPTIDQCWTEWWMPDHERMVGNGSYRANTLSMIRSTYNAHVKKRWGNTSVDQIRPLDVQQWVSGIGRNQAKKCLAIMRQLFDYVVRYGLVDSNPLNAKFILPPKSTVNEHSKQIFNYDAIGAILKASKGQWYESSLILQALGGCRVGESLWPSEVELLDIDGVPVAVVMIDGQIDNDGKEKRELKTEKSRRPVVVPGRMGTRLKEIADASKGRRLSDIGDGKGLKRGRLTKAWTSLLKNLGFDYAPIHNLRPSWQTNCRWVLKMPPWLIEPMMGHTGGGVTGIHYDRPDSQVFAEAAAEAYKNHPFDAEW